MLVDLHVHTCYSHDALIRPEDVKRFYERDGVLCAVADHNTTSAHGVLRKSGTPFIPAEEIMTTEGEVIGLFLTEEIKPHMSFYETLDAIKEQGAISYAPHPFDRFRHGLRRAEYLKKVDVIEVFNSHCFWRFNDEALSFCGSTTMLRGGGSDAHLPYELGCVMNEVDGDVEELVDNPSRFLKSMHHIKINVYHQVKVPFSGKLVKIWKMVMRK